VGTAVTNQNCIYEEIGDKVPGELATT